jgi:capsule polysaccharide export protein KpsE/RkpR
LVAILTNNYNNMDTTVTTYDAVGGWIIDTDTSVSVQQHSLADMQTQLIYAKQQLEQAQKYVDTVQKKIDGFNAAVAALQPQTDAEIQQGEATSDAGSAQMN